MRRFRIGQECENRKHSLIAELALERHLRQLNEANPDVEQAREDLRIAWLRARLVNATKGLAEAVAKYRDARFLRASSTKDRKSIVDLWCAARQWRAEVARIRHNLSELDASDFVADPEQTRTKYVEAGDEARATVDDAVRAMKMKRQLKAFHDATDRAVRDGTDVPPEIGIPSRFFALRGLRLPRGTRRAIVTSITRWAREEWPNLEITDDQVDECWRYHNKYNRWLRLDAPLPQDP